MKLAFLILAHKNPNQLVRLARFLASEGDGVFIHIDKKAEHVYQQAKDELKEVQGISLIAQRYPVYWGSCNQIEATLALASAAHDSRQYHYHALISGQDLPLMKPGQMRDFIFRNKGKEFIEHWALPNWEKWSRENGGLNRLQLFWFDGGRGMRRLTARVQSFQKKTHLMRSLKGLPPLFGGANWFTLTNDFIGWVLAHVRDNPAYLRRYRHSRCADEIFFQTLLLSSPFAKQAQDLTLRYIEWCDGPHPRTLGKEDYEKMFAGGDRLFARKFDEQVDRQIIDMVYERIERPEVATGAMWKTRSAFL